MVLRLYAVRDAKALVYMAPFAFAADAVCLRAVKDMLLEPSSELGKHAEDYAVYYVGNYIQDTGRIVVPAEGPEFVVECAALKGV